MNRELLVRVFKIAGLRSTSDDEFAISDHIT